jgi:EAL domain-containing protein (putative c-di-GMP-specific phosphodiesterase class I)
VPYFQPIIDMKTGEVLAYEVLARSRLTGLETPAAMFRAAEEFGMQIPLSQMACRKGLEASWTMDEVPHLFLNTHPDELSAPDFLNWLQSIREIAPTQFLTIEIHEAAITDIAALADLRRNLDELSMGLAFDDFGAGQARIAELAEIRPDHLKFDRRIITGLDVADPSRRRFVQSLIQAVHDLGILALAEGIETQGEFEVCRDLGFETAQGFYLGLPESVETLRSRKHSHAIPAIAE